MPKTKRTRIPKPPGCLTDEDPISIEDLALAANVLNLFAEWHNMYAIFKRTGSRQSFDRMLEITKELEDFAIENQAFIIKYQKWLARIKQETM